MYGAGQVIINTDTMEFITSDDVYSGKIKCNHSHFYDKDGNILYRRPDNSVIKTKIFDCGEEKEGYAVEDYDFNSVKTKYILDKSNRLKTELVELEIKKYKLLKSMEELAQYSDSFYKETNNIKLSKYYIF